MLRKKSEKVIVTFHTTTEAMKMESLARSEKIAGRLIPVPTIISAGCGMAWSANVCERANIEAFIQKEKIKIQEIHEIFH